jgi:hypothetical protein
VQLQRLLGRAGIIAGAALTAAVVLPSSLANWADVDHPQLAARIAPWNAAAAADAAASLAADPRNPRVRDLVRRALDRDATQVTAIELRAVDLAMSGKQPEARRLFHLSDRLSRRSLATRLWLIQDAVDRGDVAGALRDFDIALRTTTDAQPILFPVLARASADPRLTIPLARTLDRPSDWRPMFFEWTLANEADPAPIAALAAHMRDRHFVVANAIDQRLTERLVTAQDFAAARMLNRSFGRESAGVADANFSDTKAHYPFGWGLVSSGSLGAERALNGSTTVLSYSAEPANSGQVAAQLLSLAPGRYVIASKTAANATGAAPYWSLNCAGAGGEIARLDQPMNANARAETAFAVPRGCAAQWLTLTIRPAPDSNSQSGAIAWVSVSPR